MKEADLNKAIQTLVEQEGGYIVKTITTNKAGVADMLACIEGRFCAMEGKLPYNKLSELQKAHFNRVIRAGGLAKCVKSLDDARDVIRKAQCGYVQSEDIQLESFTL